MILVIQCAATKRQDAGFLRTVDDRRVIFVADPNRAPAMADTLYARPDDVGEDGATWRQKLLRYNAAPEANPLGLLPAFQLYDNDVYRRLVERFGPANVFILSAGWGLIAASFLTPYYDITFSAAAEAYKRRGKGTHYRDLNMLPNDRGDDVVFMGGKDYLPLFCSLTAGYGGPRTVFYNSGIPPLTPGCRLRRFETTTRTNWHYQCANRLLTKGVSDATGKRN